MLPFFVMKSVALRPVSSVRDSTGASGAVVSSVRLIAVDAALLLPAASVTCAETAKRPSA